MCFTLDMASCVASCYSCIEVWKLPGSGWRS